MTGRWSAIVHLGIKELRSVWHDKVLLLFMMAILRARDRLRWHLEREAADIAEGR